MCSSIDFKDFDGHVVAFSDSDWVGDKVSRKSKTGDVLMMWRHMIKAWCSTQRVIALSSGEAELYALVKAAAQKKGLSSILRDYGLSAAITVYTDATAAMGIVHRKGLNKMKHT